MSEEIEVVEIPTKNRLDHLTDVLDAQLNGDDELSKTAFHDYVTMTTKSILSPEVDDVEEIDDVVIDDIPDVDEIAAVDATDDVDVDDINITDHLPADEETED